jgi:hypothetical protein
MQPKDAAIRKRTQISKANRTMFLWIAAASALVGFAIVVSIFLAQKLLFNERVLAEKQNTITTLEGNNKVVSDLESAVRVLDTNEALASVKISTSEQAVQVILDALPSDANSSALGASLQQKLLAGIPGLTLESLQPDPVIGVESLTDATVQDASASTSTQSEITFRFTASGSQAAFKQALLNLERSIRTIDIISLRIETQGTTQLMTVQARAFYEPARTVELHDKVVKP